jgi:transcriptional regulator with XRE-family HTH domain
VRVVGGRGRIDSRHGGRDAGRVGPGGELGVDELAPLLALTRLLLASGSTASASSTCVISTYRALAAQTQSLDHAGTGLSYSHIANLAAGRELPSRRALELLARAFELPASYFAEYRLAEFRRQLDEREVGFATAYRTYQTLSRRRPLRAS